LKAVLHVDGYAGFEPLTSKGDFVLAACWSHARRRFYEVAQATNAPIAAEALRRIAELYGVEADVRGQPPAPARSTPQPRQDHCGRHADLVRIAASSRAGPRRPAEAIR
jgi:hypothetical protein